MVAAEVGAVVVVVVATIEIPVPTTIAIETIIKATSIMIDADSKRVHRHIDNNTTNNHITAPENVATKEIAVDKGTELASIQIVAWAETTPWVA